MEKEIIEKYVKAGLIAKQAREYGVKLIKDGARALDIAEAVERKIRELGGEIAFPTNISINDLAAHYTPIQNDPLIIKNEDYVKLDLGVHIDGYIADTAITIRPAGKDKLIECSEKMLEAGLNAIKPGITLGEIGEIIENIAKQYGFKSIINLSGHGLDKFNLHAGKLVYNVKNNNKYIIKEGEVYAIEPFCTTGAGSVKDSGKALIFKFMKDVPIRNPDARKILELAKTKWFGLPFARRWIKLSTIKKEFLLKQLISMNAIHAYLPLREVSNAPVAQTEHTVIVLEKPIITTI
ncbi:MAG: type II methionyl aminopeptidase [Candidatus Aenigmarchaeota archaeon]|nr:type II methionyl aminopeptidase [Candidatus Aenigmarchaeota archaeon]